MIMQRAMAIALLVALVAGAGAAVACSKGVGKAEADFPSFVYASELSLKSYRTAMEMPESVRTQIPCYCGCAGFPTPHRYLKDCFLNPDGTYTDHASGCDLCGKIALDAAAQHEEGKALKEIRANIDAKYSEYGRPTDTPAVTE